MVGLLAWTVSLALGCGGPAPSFRGTWALQGPETAGQVRAGAALGFGACCTGGGVTVELYGPAFSTGGAVPAQVSVEEEGLVWLFFPLQTALGEAEAALRLQGRQALLPLGARPGELELSLSRVEGPADPSALEAAAARAASSLDAARQAWAGGAFRLQQPDGRLVGEVLLRPDQAPVVAVYDRTWWTGGPVWSDRAEEGPDLLLSFPVEPALRGEEGLLRLNVPTSTAIVPADAVPTELDRHLSMVAGVVTQAERDAAMAAARTEADQAELEAMVELGRLLAVRALDDAGGCRSWEQVNPALADVLVGYTVRVEPLDGRCVVDVEPELPQHRRRLRARIGPEGLLDAVAPAPR